MQAEQLYRDGPFEFEFGEFVVQLDFASGSSACFLLTDPQSKTEHIADEEDIDATRNEDGTHTVITSFSTATVVGEVTIHHPCLDWIRARLRVSIPRQWHSREFLTNIREILFELLGIPSDDTWMLTASDGDATMILSHED